MKIRYFVPQLTVVYGQPGEFLAKNLTCLDSTWTIAATTNSFPGTGTTEFRFLVGVKEFFFAPRP